MRNHAVERVDTFAQGVGGSELHVSQRADAEPQRRQLLAKVVVEVSREAAARFSFLCSLTSIFAAGVYELYKEREALFASHADGVNLVAATVVSGLVGYWSIGFLLRWLRTRTTTPFIVYRLALGALLLGLIAGGVLSP